MAPSGWSPGWLLGRLARWRALLWALGPPLVLYAFHNWDLPVVACAVGAVYAVHGWRNAAAAARPRRGRCRAARARLRVQALSRRVRRPAGVLVLTAPAQRAGTAGLAGRAAGRAAAAVARSCWSTCRSRIAGYDGWRASFTFQELRKVDITTNSIWYWGFRPWSDPDEPGLPGRGRPALARAGARLVHRRAGGRLAAVAARRQLLPVDRRQRRDAVRVPAAAQGALAAVHARGSCRSSSCCGCTGAGSSPTWWRTLRWTSASSGCSTWSTSGRARHRQRLRRPGRDDRRVGSGRVVGGIVRPVPAGGDHFRSAASPFTRACVCRGVRSRLGPTELGEHRVGERRPRLHGPRPEITVGQHDARHPNRRVDPEERPGLAEVAERLR